MRTTFIEYYYQINNSLDSKNIFGISWKVAIKYYFKIKRVKYA